MTGCGSSWPSSPRSATCCGPRTIPVGIAGLALQHLFTNDFSKPTLVAVFLFINGLILLGGERLRRRSAAAESEQVTADLPAGVPADLPAAERQRAAVGAGATRAVGAGRHSSGQRAQKMQQATVAVESDRRVVRLGYLGGLLVGATQILALLPGISRDGIVMVGGMLRGLTREDAARFSFLLSAPVIFAAGVFKLHDLTGPPGQGIRTQVPFGSVLSFIGALAALRFLVRYLSDASRTLTPFAIYCLVVGLGSGLYLAVK